MSICDRSKELRYIILVNNPVILSRFLGLQWLKSIADISPYGLVINIDLSGETFTIPYFPMTEVAVPSTVIEQLIVLDAGLGIKPLFTINRI